jgi:hypothetical protein
MNHLDEQEWANHPVTVAFLVTLKESRQETLDNWAKSQYVGDSAHQGMMCNAKALGGIDVLDQVIERLEEMKKGN